MFRGKLASLGGVVAAVVLGAFTPALSAPRLNLVPPSDNRAAAPSVGRYISVQGQSFVLDRSTAAPLMLMKFDDDPEVWVLEPSPAPRGDTVYKSDTGDTVLRITRLGGVTLFTTSDPEGLPVSILGEADEIGLPFLPPNLLTPRIVQQALRASRSTPDQHQVTFDIPRYSPQTVSQFADAVLVATNAIVRLARRPDGRAFLSRLDKISFVMGPRADVSVSGQNITITLAPAKGFAGRPSSGRISKAISKR
jgi:hypothetical protein